jgi:ABC-2 type transport system permease protein
MKTQWIGFLTLVRKEIVRVFRIWPQTLMPSAVTTTLYYLIFGNFIGSRIGSYENFSYMEFIVPGLIMMAVITNSYTNTASTFFSAKFQRNIDELLVSPLNPSTILLGFMGGGMIRGIIVGTIVTLISLFFAPLKIAHMGLIIFTMVFTSALFSLAGLVNAIYSKKFDDITIIPTFVLTPLIYLGGVFYSVRLLPEFWQSISLLNPILYLVNIFRYGFLEVSDVPIFTAFFFLFVFVVGMWFFSLRLLKKGVGLSL